MRHFVSSLVFCMVISLQVYSQNLGLNNTDPKVSLDITGGLAHRAVTLNPTGNTVNIPSNLSFLIIGSIGATGPIDLIDAETLVNGRRLVILNNSGFTAVFGNFSIADGTIREFICSGPVGGWQLLTPVFYLPSSWFTTGNFGTNPEIDFLGTADDQEVSFRTNSLERMRLTNEGLKIRDDLRLEFGYGIENKPWGNGSIYYDTMGNFAMLHIYGAGKDMTGYDRRITFWADGGANFTGSAFFNGNLSINGEVKPGGNPGQSGQVLTSFGSGQMKWDFPEKTGQMIEVSPFTADTAAMAEQGYQLMGTQNRTISKTTPNGGTVSPLVNIPQIDPESHLFHYIVMNKIFAVSTNSISSISLDDGSYGTLTVHTVPAFSLANTIPVFTGTKIYIFPYFIFDCATATTSLFPANPCAGFTVSPAQAWTGSKLIIYGPNGGISFDPSSNSYTCIETGTGNLFKPGCSTIWTGSRVIFYGGYIKVGGDTISFDGGLSYNPTANSWNDLPAGGPRIHNHQALWTGTEMMVFGGRTDESFTPAGVNFYNPATLSWNTGYVPGSLSFYTHQGSRSHLAANRVFVFNMLNLDILPTTFLSQYFDLTTKSWVNFTPALRNGDERAPSASVKVNTDVLFFPRYKPCGPAVNYLNFFALESNPVYVYPKFNANLVTPSAKKIASGTNYHLSFGMHGGALNYQVSRNRWIRASGTNQPSDREGNVCISIGNNSFFVWGGKNGPTYYNTGGIYNAATNTWISISTTNAPTARSAAAAAFGNGKVLVWGGNAGGAFLNNGKLYDIASNTWSNVTNAGAPACSSFMLAEWNGTRFQTYCNGVYTYDPATGFWQFVYPDAEATAYSSSGNEYQVNITGQTGSIFTKSGNTHYAMDGNGLEFVVNQTRFISNNEILLPGNTQAQLFNALTKDFKFTGFSYQGTSGLLHSILHPAAAPNQFLIMGVRPLDTDCETHFHDAIMLFNPNTGSPVTRDINVKSLLYRRN